MSRYLDFLDRTARNLGIPVEEARALYELETSSGRNVRTSSAGAQGQMQLMPGTAKEMGVADIHNPFQNIRGGLGYYAKQRQAFGDPTLAAAAYNAGPGRVRRVGGVPNIRETKRYVSNFKNLIGARKPAPAPATGGTVEDDTDTTDAAASNPYAPTSGGLGGYGINPQDFADLQRKSEDLAARKEALRKQQFEEAQQLIDKAYGGPSASAKLMALSQAMLQPSPYRGFASTLYKLAGAMSGTQQQVEEAARKRAQAMLELRQTYTNAGLSGEEDDLTRRLALLKARAAMGKGAPFKSVIIEHGIGYDPQTAEKIVQPNPDAWAALKANPTRENYETFVNTFGQRFAEKAARIISSAGGM